MTRRLGSMILVALVFLSSGIRAQESASSGIVGQVVDSTKGAMPGATVTVINTGSFCRPLGGYLVDLFEHELSVRQIDLRRGEFRPGEVVATFPLATR